MGADLPNLAVVSTIIARTGKGQTVLAGKNAMTSGKTIKSWRTAPGLRAPAACTEDPTSVCSTRMAVQEDLTPSLAFVDTRHKNG